jgi:UDP-N-acetylglucosamine--dolichyl-phosphate N-acetylglucosaminephosphotransferase
MEPLLTLGILTSFLITLFLTPIWIKKAKQIGLIWDDMNKKGRQEIAGSGGIAVVLGFIIGVLIYIAINTFKFNSSEHLIEIFALLVSVLIVSGIGFIDDILGWQKGGLSKKARMLIVFFAAIPLMVINAGESTMIGIPFGLFYPLLLIPIGIIATTVTFNFLAGFNGLESSQGIIILLGLSLATYLTGNAWLSIILITMVSALIAFYFYNINPASVFPGDTLTYSVGALIGITAILGNIEKLAVFFFIPYIFEVVLKARGKLEKPSFGKVNGDGTLDVPYEKIYGLEHLAIAILKKIKPSKKVKEEEVVYLINAFQILIIAIGIIFIL